MRRSEGIKYLTQCADAEGRHWWNGQEYPIEECRTCNGTNDASHLHCFSRYGSTSGECAKVAWRLAWVMNAVNGEGPPKSKEYLDECMSLVVYDSDDVAYIIRNYGYRKYT